MVFKRPAAAIATEEPEPEAVEMELGVAPAPSDDACDEMQEQEEAGTAEEKAAEKDPEEMLQRQEEEAMASRRKELRAIAIDALKHSVGAQGLELGKKGDMVERLVAHEAAVRGEERTQQARVRKVVVEKKEELEALSAPDLKDRCIEEGIKGNLTKPARVEGLVKLWLEDAGVEKALAKMKHDAREQDLAAMDPKALEELCAEVAIDPFLKEVMIDRIVKCENAAGRFGRPTLEKESKHVPAPAPAGGDMVEALLASEANRKKELELKKRAEEAAAQKKADLQSKSVDELKKQLASKGRDTSGKKDELIEALLHAGLEEEVAAKRKDELKAIETVELKKMLQRKALEVSSKRSEMLDKYFAYEEKVCRDALAYSGKVDSILAESKAKLECKTGAELKEMCASKELGQSGSKEACMERLLEELKAIGEVDKLFTKQARDARWAELQAMDKEVVLKLCASLEIKPWVKEVMVERILAHEEEFGSVVEPAAKKARKTK